MSAEVPAVWPDRSITLWEDAPPGSPRGTPREALGSILIASADEKSVTAHPGETYEVPLLILSASRRLATEHQPGAILEMRNIEYRLDCQPQASGTVRVGVFTGPYEIYSGCSGAKALLVQAELRPSDGQVVIGLNARLASTADVLALEHGLRSLRIEADGILR
jgi:hypothetical protein